MSKRIQIPRRVVHAPDHPRAHKDGYVPRYWLVAEKALGRYLPKGAIVHHVDGNPQNDAPDNLVICQDQAHHKLLHKRIRAYRSSGHPNWLKCKFCKKWDAPENVYECVKKWEAWHRACANAERRERRDAERLSAN